MAMTAFEKQILNELRELVRNPKLREKDLHEWRFGEVEAQADETVVKLPRTDVSVAFPAKMDKRK